MFKGPYMILGIHGPDVTTVKGDVVRVRMFIDGRDPIDEDFALPKLPRSLYPLSEAVVREMIEPDVKARMAEEAKS